MQGVRREISSSSFGLGWEVLEHLFDVLVERLDVLAGFVGQISLRHSAPYQFLRTCVEDIDDDISDWLFRLGGGGETGPTPTPPPPPPPAPPGAPPRPEAVINGLKLLLAFDVTGGKHHGVAAGRYQLPALRLELRV